VFHGNYTAFFVKRILQVYRINAKCGNYCYFKKELHDCLFKHYQDTRIGVGRLNIKMRIFYE